MSEDSGADLQWPAHLQPGALRFSFASAEYDRTIAFYRDVVGLPVITEFADSFGEDGMILGMPGVAAHLEIVRARGQRAAADPLDQLVFYFSGAAAMRAAVAPLDAAGTPRDPSPHPYWNARGALSYLDPDERRVVYAPWVFGIEPEPGEAH